MWHSYSYWLPVSWDILETPDPSWSSSTEVSLVLSHVSMWPLISAQGNLHLRKSLDVLYIKRISACRRLSLLYASGLMSSWGSLMQTGDACGILVSGPGIKSWPSAISMLSPNHWTSSEFLGWHFDLENSCWKREKPLRSITQLYTIHCVLQYCV